MKGDAKQLNVSENTSQDKFNSVEDKWQQWQIGNKLVQYVDIV